MARHEIAEATRKDELCNKVKKALETNEWDDRNLKAFRTLKNEFLIASDGIILRGTRILIPHELRKRTIELAHEAHQGLDKTKALIREKIWFPNIDIQIKDMIENCIPCLATGVSTKPEPIKLTRMPEAPWEKIHIDFKGPLPGGKYLMVVIDRYTRYPEVEIISTNDSNQVIRKLHKMFAAHGIPKIMVSEQWSTFS